MDGLDLMTVAEVVPLTAAMVLLGWTGAYPPAPRWWRPRYAAPCSDLRRSTGQSQRFSRRRRQPADRPVARLVPAATRLASAAHRGAAAAALLSRRRHHHAVSPDRAARAVLGRAPQPFLSARHRQWLHSAVASSPKYSNSISFWRCWRWHLDEDQLRSSSALACSQLARSAVALLLYRFSRRPMTMSLTSRVR